MTKARLKERFDKIYESYKDDENKVTELLVDMMNFFSSNTLEEFYEFVKKEKGLDEETIDILD